MTKIVTLGEILVEIVAEDRGDGFRQPVRLVGPFPAVPRRSSSTRSPSWASPAASSAASGTTTSAGSTWSGSATTAWMSGRSRSARSYPTGSAFVRYRDNGERDFVYNIKNSACGQVRWTDGRVGAARRVRPPARVRAVALLGPDHRDDDEGHRAGEGQGRHRLFRPQHPQGGRPRPRGAGGPGRHAGVVRHLPAQRGRADPADRRRHAGGGDLRDPRSGGHRHRGEERCRGGDVLRRRAAA